MEPEGFRLNLNNLIQNLRNVTWLLQKQKSQLPDFDIWYQQWRESVRDDQIMKWVVASRNRIVKEADLELLSRADIRWSVDWLNECRASWTMPPRYTTRQILIRILSGQKIPPVGLLTIERRWIDRKLPNNELLDALVYAYAKTSSVIATAHHNSGVTECDLQSRASCVTPSLSGKPLVCMQQWGEGRRLQINLEDRVEISERVEIIPKNLEKEKLAGQRYGDLTTTGDAIERVPQMLEINKRMLLADKSLLTVSLLFVGDRQIDDFVLDFYDQTSKRIAIHRLADRIELFDADGVLFISEIWLAELGPDEVVDGVTIPARDRANRREAIKVVGATRDGRQADATCVFTRMPDGEIILGETIHNMGGQLNLLEPVRQRWKKLAAKSRETQA